MSDPRHITIRLSDIIATACFAAFVLACVGFFMGMGHG